MIITRSPFRVTLGGGFPMFYAEDKARLRHALFEAGLREVRLRFDFDGTGVVIQ